MVVAAWVVVMVRAVAAVAARVGVAVAGRAVETTVAAWVAARVVRVAQTAAAARAAACIPLWATTGPQS